MKASTVTRIQGCKKCAELLTIRDDLAKSGKSLESVAVHETYLACEDRKYWMLAGAGIAGLAGATYLLARYVGRRRTT